MYPTAEVAGMGHTATHTGPVATEAKEAQMERIERMMADLTGVLQDTAEQSPFVRLRRMAEELENSRASRRGLEEQATKLERLVEREHSDREAWLDAFASGVRETLRQVARRIDASVVDCTRLGTRRFDMLDMKSSELALRVQQVCKGFPKPMPPHLWVGGALNGGPPMRAGTPTSAMGSATPGGASTPGSEISAPGSIPDCTRSLSPHFRRPLNASLRSLPSVTMSSLGHAHTAPASQASTPGRKPDEELFSSLDRLLAENRRLEKQREDLLDAKRRKEERLQSRKDAAAASFRRGAAAARNAISADPLSRSAGSVRGALTAAALRVALPTVDEAG